MIVPSSPLDLRLAHELLRTHLQVRVPLTDADFMAFCGYLRPLALRKRQHLLQAGEVCTTYAFVTQGCLRSYSLTPEGHEHTLQFAPEDWWISDLYSLLTQQPSTMSIDALEDSQLLLLDQADLESIYARCPIFERYFRLLMQSRYVVLQERVNAALSQTAAENTSTFCASTPPSCNGCPSTSSPPTWASRPNR